MDSKKNIQEALNRSLSGLNANPFLAQRVIAEAKGEEKVKKKMTGAMILVIVLVLAMMGTGYALFSSQVAAYFGKLYGSDMEEWLQQGKAAQLGDSVTVGDVIFTLDEVVYKNRGLFGVGTVKASHPEDVLIPNEFAYVEPEEFSLLKGVHELVEKAGQNGGRMLTVDVMPMRIGVDGGEMLIPGAMGYFDELNEDGTMTYSFEVEDGFALADGTEYSVQLDFTVSEMDSQGAVDLNNSVRDSWTAVFTPVTMEEPTQQPQTAPVSADAITTEGYTLIAPEEYKEKGTMPVYRATAINFIKLVDPSWFNQSGIAEKQSNNYFKFNDHAVLSLSPEAIWYAEYSAETYDANQAERERYTPDIAPDYQPMPAFSYALMNIASDVHVGNKEFVQNVGLEHEALTLITLKDAKAQAEGLLEKLGIKGFECAYALDMSVDRIITLGEKYNAFWYESKQGYSNLPRQDYSAATPEDEGYYLYYSVMGLDDSDDTRHFAAMFINCRGIAYVNIYNYFNRGEALYTPETLITPEQALELMSREVSKARYVSNVESIKRVALSYGAVRADNKADGMVFVPAWQIQFWNGKHMGYAIITAVDGTLIDASFL
ncbi:MAG: hypothetical protein IJ157_01760 [Clostridia bacterium]|nr:hypothetical protein [Clostridia bacterium]